MRCYRNSRLPFSYKPWWNGRQLLSERKQCKDLDSTSAATGRASASEFPAASRHSDHRTRTAIHSPGHIRSGERLRRRPQRSSMRRRPHGLPARRDRSAGRLDRSGRSFNAVFLVGELVNVKRGRTVRPWASRALPPPSANPWPAAASAMAATCRCRSLTVISAVRASAGQGAVPPTHAALQLAVAGLAAPVLQD